MSENRQPSAARPLLTLAGRDWLLEAETGILQIGTAMLNIVAIVVAIALTWKALLGSLSDPGWFMGALLLGAPTILAAFIVALTIGVLVIRTVDLVTQVFGAMRLPRPILLLVHFVVVLSVLLLPGLLAWVIFVQLGAIPALSPPSLPHP